MICRFDIKIPLGCHKHSEYMLAHAAAFCRKKRKKKQLYKKRQNLAKKH